MLFYASPAAEHEKRGTGKKSMGTKLSYFQKGETFSSRPSPLTWHTCYHSSFLGLLDPNWSQLLIEASIGFGVGKINMGRNNCFLTFTDTGSRILFAICRVIKEIGGSADMPCSHSLNTVFAW